MSLTVKIQSCNVYQLSTFPCVVGKTSYENTLSCFNPSQIQRRWRGFFVRKYVHNFYARKTYLEGVSRKNELVR